MEDEIVVCPSQEQLEMWIEYLKNDDDRAFGRFLPVTDERWYSEILGVLERVMVPYISGVSSKAAHLFYYIIKDHRFPDGNKRSGIVVAYLFFLVNGCEIESAERIRFLAKKVARSHGSIQKDEWIRKIQKEFSYVCKPLQP
jgi:death-on-curing family protein